MPRGEIIVLAGVNGAGKSSVAGERTRNEGLTYWNPDEEARRLLGMRPGLDPAEANEIAWRAGVSLLRQRCVSGESLAFETTLGGGTITRILEDAAHLGKRIRVLYVGLESPDLHLARVRARAARGGHDIPESLVRLRWERSPRNLVRLLPLLHQVELYHNSAEAAPGTRVHPLRIASQLRRRLTLHLPPERVPAWARPVVAAMANRGRE